MTRDVFESLCDPRRSVHIRTLRVRTGALFLHQHPWKCTRAGVVNPPPGPAALAAARLLHRFRDHLLGVLRARNSSGDLP